MTQQKTSVVAGSAKAAGATPPAPERGHLTLPCLGADEDQPFRRLAWAVSICGFFLIIGLLGLRPARTPVPEPAASKTLVPVTLVAAEQLPPPASEGRKEPALPAALIPADMPRISSILAPRTPEVVLALPVAGTEILVPLPGVEPPPRATTPAAVIPTQFDAAGTASTPQPEYPSLALRRRNQGRVVVQFTVTAAGKVESVKLGRSSGHAALDDAALNVVKERWHFPPGEVRHHFVEIEFQLK